MLVWSISDSESQAKKNKCNPSTVEFPVGTLGCPSSHQKIPDEYQKLTEFLKISPPDGSIGHDSCHYAMNGNRRHTSSKKMMQVSLSMSVIRLSQNAKWNLKITPLLDGGVSSQLICEVTSDFTLVPTSDPCNPNTSILPTETISWMWKFWMQFDEQYCKHPHLLSKYTSW